MLAVLVVVALAAAAIPSIVVLPFPLLQLFVPVTVSDIEIISLWLVKLIKEVNPVKVKCYLSKSDDDSDFVVLL